MTKQTKSLKREYRLLGTALEPKGDPVEVSEDVFRQPMKRLRVLPQVMSLKQFACGMAARGDARAKAWLKNKGKKA